MIIFTTRCKLNFVLANMLSNESLAPEKVCTVFFGRGKLKITMKRLAACCVCQYYASNSYLCAAKF